MRPPLSSADIEHHLAVVSGCNWKRRLMRAERCFEIIDPARKVRVVRRDSRFLVPALDETPIDRSIAGTCTETYLAPSRRLRIFLAAEKSMINTREKSTTMTSLRDYYRSSRSLSFTARLASAYCASVFAIIHYFTSAFFRTTSFAECVALPSVR